MNKETQKSDLDENKPSAVVPEYDNSQDFLKNYIFSLLDIITFISLSFVVFGILTLGFLVAPVVFNTLNPRALASEIMSDIFLRYYPYAFTSILITVGSELLRFLLKSKELLKSKVWFLQFIIILTVTFLTGYSNYILLPQINDMRLNQKGPTLWTDKQFIVLHKRSEDFAMAIFLLGLIPLCFMVARKR